MPSWTPNREDVRFDAALAEKAAVECDETAARLSVVWSTLGGPAGEAQASWDGTARTGFDDGWARIEDEQSTVRAALTALARNIRLAAAAAVAEQDHRISERARWQRELDAEVAANPPCRPGEPC